MMVIPGTFEANIIGKKKKYHTKESLKIGNEITEVSSSTKLLGVQIDHQLNFNLHIFCYLQISSNSAQCSDKLKRFLAFEEKKTQINSCFYSNFNYSLLVWIFFGVKSLKKVKSLQKRALCFLYHNYGSSYDSILKLAGKSTMNVTRFRNLCIEFLKH